MYRAWHQIQPIYTEGSRNLLNSEYIYIASSGLYPSLGYELGLWTSNDPPVKIVKPIAQHKWGSKNSLYIAFYILTFYEVMLCFNWNRWVSVFYTLGLFGGPACVDIKNPWWWHTWNIETCRKETVRRLRLIFSARIIGLISWKQLRVYSGWKKYKLKN
jgi:hypothetical protein